jgi:hypothetical protein
MSFEDVDLLAAIGHIKHGNMIANQHRKQSASLPTRLAGLLIGSLNTSGVGWIRSMTAMERHAELVRVFRIAGQVTDGPLDIRFMLKVCLKVHF